MKRLVGCAVLLLLILGCTEAPPSPGREPAAITNAALGIRLTAVPADFEVTANEGETLELRPSAANVKGRLWFTVGPETRAINVVAAMKNHQREIEERPEAAYKGAQELVTHLGAAFYSRGQYLGGTTPMEETAVFVGHPSQSRLLTLTYRYPAGVDASVRVQQLLEVLGEVEALTGVVP